MLTAASAALAEAAPAIAAVTAAMLDIATWTSRLVRQRSHGGVGTGTHAHCCKTDSRLCAAAKTPTVAEAAATVAATLMSLRDGRPSVCDSGGIATRRTCGCLRAVQTW